MVDKKAQQAWFRQFLKNRLKEIVKGSNRGNARGGEIVYHGTPSVNADSIQRQGFRLSTSSHYDPHGATWFGQGVYNSHDPFTGQKFARGKDGGRLFQGTLPPGFRYTELPETTHSRHLLNHFHRQGLRPILEKDGKPPVKWIRNFDLDGSLRRYFPGMDGIRITDLGEPQLLIFDADTANTVYNTDGPKGGPRTPLSQKPLKAELSNKVKMKDVIKAASLVDKSRGFGASDFLRSGLFGMEAGKLLQSFKDADTKYKAEEKAKIERKNQESTRRARLRTDNRISVGFPESGGM
jgi:hypothetical protein